MLVINGNIDSLDPALERVTLVNVSQLPKLPDSLISLRLIRSEIQVLPREIGFLRNLDCLDLSDNKLTMLPSEFGLLSNLTHLTIAGNPITRLPREFRFLELMTLDITDTKISNLIVNGKRLQRLSTTRNGVDTLGTCAPNLIGLHTKAKLYGRFFVYDRSKLYLSFERSNPIEMINSMPKRHCGPGFLWRSFCDLSTLI